MKFKVNKHLAVSACALVFFPSLLTISVSTKGHAFGTIREMGQNIEHGRITRRALACKPNSAVGTCFETKTLDSLAGKKGQFGAVGAPDRGRALLTSNAHCSGGDYFNIEGYPQTKAKAAATLKECRDYMIENLNHAVLDAAKLIGSNNKIKRREASLELPCVYRGTWHGRAKCNVLAHMGRILHASQDFYAHSNWVDLPDASRQIGIDNPPGLGFQGPSPWLNLRLKNPTFPYGLISGCFDKISFVDEEKGCYYGSSGAHRIRHLDVSKDTGTIDPTIGSGKSERGKVNNNFKRAVEAAIADSVDKWAIYRELLVKKYGQEKAMTMICALTHDNPTKSCSS